MSSASSLLSARAARICNCLSQNAPFNPNPLLNPNPCAGIAADEQRIVFAGRQLADDCCLASSGIADEATLNVLARLAGGAKKRKKKTYTKPKKIKHKHKKIKLRVLKFYKVSLCSCRRQSYAVQGPCRVEGFARGPQFLRVSVWKRVVGSQACSYFAPERGYGIGGGWHQGLHAPC